MIGCFRMKLSIHIATAAATRLRQFPCEYAGPDVAPAGCIVLNRELTVDEALAESFPASDPPSWTLGMARPRPVRRTGERNVIDGVTSLAAAGGLVLLVPFVILFVGVPLALVVRGLLEAVSWLLGFVSS